MKTETKEIYKCEFCNKIYQISKYCLEHERACKNNPENHRPCYTCIELDKKTETLYEDTLSGEIEINYKLLYCSAKDCFLHPPSVEIKGNAIWTESAPNKPMPKVCDRQRSDLINISLFCSPERK